MKLTVVSNYINHHQIPIARELYDKLKVSEEKLIEVNKELEGYVDTIEEITLLKERNRISREIHDSVGHALSTAMIQLTAMEAIAEKSRLECILSMQILECTSLRTPVAVISSDPFSFLNMDT